MFFVFRDSYVIYIWVMNILCTFHKFMYVYVTYSYMGMLLYDIQNIRLFWGRVASLCWGYTQCIQSLNDIVLSIVVGSRLAFSNWTFLLFFKNSQLILRNKWIFCAVLKIPSQSIYNLSPKISPLSTLTLRKTWNRRLGTIYSLWTE